MTAAEPGAVAAAQRAARNAPAAHASKPERFSLLLELISNAGLMDALSTGNSCRACMALWFLALFTSLGSCRGVEYVVMIWDAACSCMCVGICGSTRGRVGAPESFRGLYQGILRGLYQAYQGVNWGLVRAWSGCFVVDFVRRQGPH